jgi:hypothetical protein
MKNSKNDITSIDNDTTVFGDLPTAEEADRMLAEADEAAAVFDESAVIGVALAKMQADITSGKTPSTSSEATVRTGRRKLRKSLRVILIAAGLSVFLLVALGAAARIIYDVRFTQLIGLEGTMQELENGYFEIGLTRTLGDLTITMVDAIGDTHTQWVEMQTSVKLPDGTPDGWLYTYSADGEIQSLLPADYTRPIALMDFDLNYYDGSLRSTVFSDIDCTEYYYDTLIDQKGSEGSCTICPFCRDGYLWYLIEINPTYAKVNRGFVHFTFTLDGKWPFEFNWCNNYTSDEKTFRVKKDVDDATVSKVILSAAELILDIKGSRDSCRLESIRLADGTVLNTMTYDTFSRPSELTFAAQETPEWDGWLYYSEEDSSCRKQYSLLPGQSFRTPSTDTRLIPMNEIVAITVNGAEISLR